MNSRNMQAQEIIVSICMLTYNHELYIDKAIESVLGQVTNFRFELVIGEDFSTDRTREICIEYRDKFPDVIKLITRDSNLGMYGNHIDTLKHCIGKYTAFCEGDDYWIDSYKLQKQVDFLEKHNDYGLVHTNHLIYHQEENRFESLEQNKDTGYIFSQLLHHNEMATLTVLTRTNLIQQAINDKYCEHNFVTLDYPLWMYIAHISKVHYINDVTGVYRKLSESASNTKDELKMYKFLIGITDIQIYYAERYGELHILLDSMVVRRKRNIKYAYMVNNKEISEKAYLFLRKYNRLDFKDKMFYYCTNYKIIRFLMNPIVKIKNRKVFDGK